MTIAEQQGEHERMKAEEAIAAAVPPGEIQSVRVELGEEHSGDPSLWVIFRIHPEAATDLSWIKKYSAYSTKLTLKLIDSGLKRFPYTRLERAA